MPTAFLIHWHQAEVEDKATELRSWGWDVRTEHTDDARAGRTIHDEPPQVVVISFARLPSHGRETADYLQRAKSTRAIPLVLVDGTPNKVAAVRARLPNAAHTTWEKLQETLAALALPESPRRP